MSLASLMVRTVTVITAGTRTDAFGDPQPDWTTPVETTVPGWLAFQSSTEILDGRDATSTVLMLTVPAGTAISRLSRVRIDGRTYQVDGEPMSAWTPRGEHHIESRLAVWDG